MKVWLSTNPRYGTEDMYTRYFGFKHKEYKIWLFKPDRNGIHGIQMERTELKSLFDENTNLYEQLIDRLTKNEEDIIELNLQCINVKL